MKWITESWNRYWFTETPYTRLALFRILTLFLVLNRVLVVWQILILDAQGRGGIILSREWQPIFILEFLSVKNPPDTLALMLIFLVLIVAIVLGIIGLFTRISCAVVAILFLYWIGASYSFGQAHHSMVALAFALIALPLSPCGMRLSIDSLIDRLKRIHAGNAPFLVPRLGKFAGWSLQLIQISISISYCAAGISKMVIIGPMWANGYTVQSTILGGGGPLSELLSQNVILVSIMSVITLVAEIGFPIVLYWSVSRWFILPIFFTFHLISWATGIIGNSYIGLWYMFICFIPLEKVGYWVTSAISVGTLLKRIICTSAISFFTIVILALYFIDIPFMFVILLFFPVCAGLLAIFPSYKIDILFDGTCGLCRQAAGTISALDWSDRVRFLDISQWENVIRIHPNLNKEDCIARLC